MDGSQLSVALFGIIVPGIISTARPIIANEFGATSSLMTGLLTSTILIGAMIGSFLGGVIATKFGRRLSNTVGSLCQLLGILAADIYTFLFARAVVGAGIGITSVVCPLYVSEQADPNRRGIFGVLFQLFITFGIFVSNLVGWGLSTPDSAGGLISGGGAFSFDQYFKWRLMLVLGAVFPFLLLIHTVLKMKDSKKVEQNELFRDEINARIDGSLEPRAGASRKTLVQGFLMETVLACILQLTGINAVMFYGPTIISQAGDFFAANKNAFNIGIGFSNFIFTIGAVVLVERLGRKPLMVFGTAVMSVALVGLGVIFMPAVKSHLGPIPLGVTVLIALFVFLFGFEIGPGCLFWVLVNENFPEEHSQYKEVAATYANVLQWVINLIISLGFPVVQSYSEYVFLVFGGVGFVCTAYLVFFMKETRQAARVSYEQA